MKSVALFALMLACGAVVANDDAVSTPDIAAVVETAEPTAPIVEEPAAEVVEKVVEEVPAPAAETDAA